MASNTPSEPPPDYKSAAAQHGAPAPFKRGAPVRKGPVPLDLPIISYLKSKRVILASASPRRKALLAQVGLPGLEILPSTEPEDLSKKEYLPEAYVSATAQRKCLSVYKAALAAQAKDPSKDEPAVIIAADTIIVTRDGAILEKPRSEADHRQMLKRLRDTRVHRCLTAVCVVAPKADASYPGYEIGAHTEETKVYFAPANEGLPDEVVDAYIRSREGVDKAGGYAIQGIAGMMLVEKIEGSVDNVVGLPVRKCLQLCEKVVFRQGEDDVEDDEGEDIV